ncbi:UNVERIFIED_CONTAM: hypothetical protein FKN15_050033, partial [Acipenser sinensis]
ISQLPVATKVWWTSINFKTILEWEPKPSGYAYTVEFFGKKTDVQKSPRCIKIQTTECDLTSFLLNLTDSYTAHVISEPIETVDKTEEYPYTRSDKFTPYKDTKIGQPTFKIEENEAKDNIKLLIEAPLSSIRGPNNTFLRIQEIFKKDLEYVTYYRKASSTGKVSFLLNLTDSYTAHVISEPIETVDKTEEYPYTRSDKFTPYKDTKIGQPTFKIEENEAKDNIKLLIEAPLSSIRGPNNTFLRIQEIFKKDLEYVTYYRKASSTGKNMGLVF